jgi:hypothetical protein
VTRLYNKSPENLKPNALRGVTSGPDRSARLSRQQRRRLDRALRKLHRTDACSFCGTPFPHNSQTAGGLDAQGNLVLAGECCMKRVAKIFTRGFYSTRNYDFLLQHAAKSTSTELTGAQITDAIAAYQKVIAATDKRFDGIERRGGVGRSRNVSTLDTPWKDDDRVWFEQNRERSHRMRTPFPGELDGVEIPTDRKVIMLVRQVEPGDRLRVAFDPDVVLLPGSPNDEAFAHALFEVATGHEAVPHDCQTLRTLIEKYNAKRGQ